MAVQTIESGDARLTAEAFGDPSHPAILLIMGAMASMLWWPADFCRDLAARGRHVIRYDNRDTGLSTKYEPGKPFYNFDTMAGDTLAVLDGYDVGVAHVVGMSMGGMIGQIVALRHPSRVLSLTAISTSPLGISGLPPMTEAYRSHSADGEAVDWSNRSQVVDFVVKDANMLAGTAHGFDAARTRAFVEQDYDRSGGYLSATNHFLLGGEGPTVRAVDLKLPLRVIHGTADPLFPVQHGMAFAEAVPGARLFRLEGGGHELHPADWPAIIDGIVALDVIAGSDVQDTP